MLEKEHLRSIGWEDKVLLNLLFLFSTEWRIREDDIIAILVLDITNIGRECIYLADIWIVHSVQYHIHHAEYIRKWRFLVSEECLIIEESEFLIRLHLRLDMIECLDEESTTSCCRIIDRLSDLWIHEIDDELDDATRRVELS